MKTGQKCYALFINIASQFVSFKIAKGRYFGNTKAIQFDKTKYDCVFEDDFESVDYLSSDDLFLTENDAIKHLIEILKEKVK